MLRSIAWLGLAVAMAQALRAADLKLPALRVDPRTYTNVTVFGANATDLYFSHAKGLANVKLKYLDPELQKLFSFDPVAAAQAEKQQADDERRYAESLAKSIETEAANRLRGPATLGENSLADPLSDKTPLNKPMPDLAVDKWLTEKPDVRGRFVIVFFWTTTSAPCRPYVAQLNSWQKKYDDKLVVIGISPESEQQVGQMTEPPLAFASALDSKSGLANAVGVTEVPQILLSDSKGIVRYRGHPAAVTEKRLEQLFALFPEAAK